MKKLTQSLTSTAGAVRALIGSVALVLFAQPKPDKWIMIALGSLYIITSFIVSIFAGDEPRDNTKDDR